MVVQSLAAGYFHPGPCGVGPAGDPPAKVVARSARGETCLVDRYRSGDRPVIRRAEPKSPQNLGFSAQASSLDDSSREDLMWVQSATYGREPGTGVSRHVEGGDQRKWLRVR
jgi:hypothetical protein